MKSLRARLIKWKDEVGREIEAASSELVRTREGSSDGDDDWR